MNKNIIGIVDNIVYDFHRGRLTPQKEIEMMTMELSHKEANSIIKWWNKAQNDGVNSVSHLKLMYNAISIIQNHLKTKGDLLGLTDSVRYLVYKDIII